ncbi:MAG: three-Cys-motif partner protein TcmP [Bacilli bacterium]|nr:three-Cys-motif partner protein TcmP [Bacilli bacterium]
MDAYIKNIIKQERKYLTDKSPHTAHKIKYVKEYIRYWLFVACNHDKTTEINFIDCMSNAGIYSDGDYCTAIEVASEFIEFSKKYPNKHFNVLINDLNENKIRIAKIVVEHKFPKLPKNMHIMFDVMDVNEYLEIVKQKYRIFIFQSFTVLFVDPFDFRTVHIPHLQKFIERTYCEVFFNLMTNDSTRNGIDDGIAKSIGEEIRFASKYELWSYVAKKLTVGKMKYCFSYTFKNSKNAEVYQILFITPHDAGLRKLKNAIWKVFHGDECYSSYFSNGDQLSLLPDEADIKMIAQKWAEEAMQLLKIEFPNKVISYNEIDNFILTRSMLMGAQIIEYLLKPYIKKGFIKKIGKYPNNTFKKDSYFIKG